MLVVDVIAATPICGVGHARCLDRDVLLARGAGDLGDTRRAGRRRRNRRVAGFRRPRVAARTGEQSQQDPDHRESTCVATSAHVFPRDPFVSHVTKLTLTSYTAYHKNPPTMRRPALAFTLVTFHAHPDDESIATAGTMARAKAEGHRVVLVVATRGELGEFSPDALAPGETLTDRRVAEAAGRGRGARRRPGRVPRLPRLRNGG